METFFSISLFSCQMWYLSLLLFRSAAPQEISALLRSNSSAKALMLSSDFVM